jgi:hypothetical protein
MPHPQIPEELTRAYWQAHKGVTAKMAGPTGVSEAMDDVQAAYNNIDWLLFDDTRARAKGLHSGIEAFDAEYAKARAEYPKVVELRKRVFVVRDRARDAGERFGANRLIPSSSRLVAENVATAAEHFAVELRSMGDVWEHRREELVQQLEEFRRTTGILVRTVEERAQAIALLANPTAEQLYNAVQQKCATIYINVRSAPDLRPQLMDDWKRVSQKEWYAIPNGQPVREKCGELQVLAAHSVLVLAMPH